MPEERPLKLVTWKTFDRSLKKLPKRGGIADAVHKQVVKALVRWEQGEDAMLPRTHHGESRVPHVVKYDLKGYYRLVVYEHAGKRVPLVVGDHEETDKWLEGHRGHDFTVNIETGRVSFMDTKTDVASARIRKDDIDVPAILQGPVFNELPADALVHLCLSEATLQALHNCVTFEAVDDGSIWYAVEALVYPSSEHKAVVMQIIALISEGRIEEAQERIELFLGRADTASACPESFSQAIDSGSNSDVFADMTRLSPEEIEQIFNAKGLTDWMLYLHPDQEKLVRQDHSGPARLLGVSGSGKTSVLVHRARYLAKLYPGERILILSINPSLCRLIRSLLDVLCGGSTNRNVDVMTIYDYCYEAVKTISPGQKIEKLDRISGEDLPACWHDFLEKPHALAHAQPIIDALEKREDYVDASSFLLDELIWIRSGFGRENRDSYYIAARQGRGIRLPIFDPAAQAKSEQVIGMPIDSRQRILLLLRDYEEYMNDGGLLDDDGVSLEAYSLRDRIPEHSSLRARCVLVDEVQDTSTVELAVLGKIPTSPHNGVFLAGDPVQKVFAKQHDLAAAGLDIIGRGKILRRNYRNSRQILHSAFSIINEFKDMAEVPKDDILEPEYAFKNGSRPTLYECATREEQTALIMWYLSVLAPEDFDSTCIASPYEEGLETIEGACEAAGIPVSHLGGTRDRGVIGTGVKLSLLRDVKGFEFRHVFLVDLVDSCLLPKGMPWEERWRVAFQLYVAMTRARDDLVMSFILNRSIMLSPLKETVEECSAQTLLQS